MLEAVALIVAVVALILCASGVLVWLRMLSRVTVLEAKVAAGMSHAEFRQLDQRLATIEGTVIAQRELLTTMQNHLLKGDRA